jgi:thioredoxin-dependent adenylylsulfate APS reductase
VAWAVEQFGSALAIGTSFQKEGMVVLDMAARMAPEIRVFTLDTGCLPAETREMIAAVERRYGVVVERVEPDPREVARMVAAHGRALYYRDVAHRMLCCEVRKARPLARKLAGLGAWLTGLRRDQSGSRAGVPKVDAGGAVLKISPLADWTSQEVDEYIRAHDVPVHPLYAQGYRSIGCAPCTRAAGEGEDARSGRWWWERGAEKECGIHFTASGRAERQVDVLLREILEAKVA